MRTSKFDRPSADEFKLMKNFFIVFLFLMFVCAQAQAQEDIMLTTQISGAAVPVSTVHPMPISVTGGTTGQCLTSNGASTAATFQACGGGGGGGSPGGSTNDLQYNAGGGNFGGITMANGTIAIGTTGSFPVAVAPSGDWTITNAGVNTIAKVHGVVYPSGPSANTVPVVTSAATGGTVTYEAVPNAALANSSITIAGHSVALGGTQTIAIGDLVAIGSNTFVGNPTSSSAVPTAGTLPTCTDSGGNHLNYTLGTGFSCGTSSSAAGTVTTVSVATANGFSGTVANATTTPAITIIAGAITPSSVVASGSITGAALIPSGNTIPTDGLYLPASNTSAIADQSLPVVYHVGVASAVDYFTMTNAATASPAALVISSTGTDTNIALGLTPKGTGGVTITSASANALAVGPNGTTTPVLKVDGSTASVVTGIGISGTATGGTGSVIIATTSDTNGTALNLNLKGANATASGLGGGVNITGGTSSTNAAGSAIAITGGAAVGGNVAGAVTITGGAAGSSTGGAVTLQGGAGTTGLAAGLATVQGGTAGVSGNGGAVAITGRNAGTTSGNNAGGAVTITSGKANLTGAAGTIGITSGGGGSSTAGGAITLTTGNGGSSSGASGSITLAIGTTAAGNVGVINFGGGIISTGTKFTASGCSNGSTVGGATAGQFASGTTGACSVVITMNGASGATAPNGWACSAADITTTSDTLLQTATTTTTATIAGTTISGDTITFSCMGY